MAQTTGREIAGRPIAGLALLLLAGLALCLVTLWLVTLRLPGAELADQPAGPPVTIHVLDNGFHTDLLLPRQALMDRGGPLAAAVERAPGRRWVRVGWGDEAFFTDQRPIADRWPDALRAAFAPANPSVLMLGPGPDDPGRLPPRHRVTLSLSPVAFDALAGQVETSLSLDPAGRPRVRIRLDDGTVFLAARPRFHLTRLCNHFTAEALRAAGMPVRPVLSAFSGAVMADARRWARLDTGRDRG